MPPAGNNTSSRSRPIPLTTVNDSTWRTRWARKQPRFLTYILIFLLVAVVSGALTFVIMQRLSGDRVVMTPSTLPVRSTKP